MSRTAIGLVVLVAACGKGDSSRGGGAADDPVVAAAMAKPAVHVDAATWARGQQAARAAQGGPYATVVEATAAVLGRPTMVDPERAQVGELTWAVVDGPACHQLRVSRSQGRGEVAPGEYAPDNGTDFWECVDAARGKPEARGFGVAEPVLDNVKPATLDQMVQELHRLGAPALRAEQGGVQRVVWASRDELRCWYAIGTIAKGAPAGKAGAAPKDTDRYAQCSDWASGKPTGLWTGDLAITAN